MTVVELGPGSILEDIYRLEEPIAEGAGGRIWKALHIRLKKPVAVKVPKIGGGDPAKQAKRFLREARLAAAVSHPCVARVTDFGSASETQPYMVMDLLTGESLAGRCDRRPAPTADEVLSIIDSVLSGLQAVHDAGIVHRDIKPANIFLAETPQGMVPKLTDFGVSRVPRQPGDEHGMRSVFTTRKGLLVGTPEYMSPEQARGIPDVDKRADIFALGVVLYEALTGRMPFEAKAIGDLVIQVVRVPHTPATELGVDEAVSSIIDRALMKDPDDRYPSANEMRDAIRALRTAP